MTPGSDPGRRARSTAGRGPRRVRKGGALVSEHRLENGVRVLLAERRADPVVAVLLLYRVGSVDEREEQAGVSHFLEHMMFKGTPTIGKGEVDRITTELGGQNNAFTGNDHTGYWFELASDRWEMALAIEADRMRNLLLDPEEFDAERAVVLEELAMGEDDPWRVLARRVQTALFPRHAYRNPIIGYPETLAGMTPADMHRHYRRYYRPGNALLVVCGDITRPSALELVDKHFGSLPAEPAPEAEPEPYRGTIEEPGGEQRITLSWPDAARRLCMAWPTVTVCSDDDYTLDVITTLLASGRMSRLQRRLVLDEGLATSLSISNDTRCSGGVLWLFAECAQGVEPDALEAAIDEELERLRTERVAPAELKRAKSVLESSEAYDCETVSDLAEELGEFALDADWRLAFDGGERHGTVTAKRVQDCAARLLGPERRVLGWSLPREDSPADDAPRARRRKKARRGR